MRSSKRKEVRDELKGLLIKYGGPKKVAEYLGISHQAVYAKMKRYGIQYDKIREKDDEEYICSIIHKKYVENKTMGEIAEESGCSSTTISRILSEHVSVYAMKTLEEQLILRYGSNIRLIRLLRGLTQKQLAEGVSFHQVHICDIERGRMSVSNNVLDKIAKHLGVGLKDLLDFPSHELIKSLISDEA